MPDKTDNVARITVICNDEFKRSVKAAILNSGIKNFQEGYKKIMEIGLKNFLKEVKQ